MDGRRALWSVLVLFFWLLALIGPAKMVIRNACTIHPSMTGTLLVSG